MALQDSVRGGKKHLVWSLFLAGLHGSPHVSLAHNDDIAGSFADAAGFFKLSTVDVTIFNPSQRGEASTTKGASMAEFNWALDVPKLSCHLIPGNI